MDQMQIWASSLWRSELFAVIRQVAPLKCAAGTKSAVADCAVVIVVVNNYSCYLIITLAGPPCIISAVYVYTFYLHGESNKVCHPNHGSKFVSSLSICKILSLLHRAVNFRTKLILGYPPHLKYVAALPWKTSKSEIYNSRVRKTCFKCDFVSSVQQTKMPKVMKISAKINTMQNINILLFVRSLSLTSLKLCS